VSPKTIRYDPANDSLNMLICLEDGEDLHEKIGEVERMENCNVDKNKLLMPSFEYSIDPFGLPFFSLTIISHEL
jgi:hypothetical protein